MKKVALSLAVFAAFSGAANAAIINVGNVSVPSLGNVLSSETTSNLNQVYFFNLLSNAGSLTASYNSDPVDNTLVGKLYASNSSGALLTQIGSFGPVSGGNVLLSYGSITAGYYAFQFTSTSASPITYSGQFSARVPAPAVLGLAGIGLVGLGLFSRRRTAA